VDVDVDVDVARLNIGCEYMSWWAEGFVGFMVGLWLRLRCDCVCVVCGCEDHATERSVM
jgi:hypothetical protein